MHQMFNKIPIYHISRPLVPETTPSSSYPDLGKVTFSLVLFAKFNKPLTLGSQIRLGERDNYEGRVVSPRQVG